MRGDLKHGLRLVAILFLGKLYSTHIEQMLKMLAPSLWKQCVLNLAKSSEVLAARGFLCHQQTFPPWLMYSPHVYHSANRMQLFWMLEILRYEVI